MKKRTKVQFGKEISLLLFALIFFSPLLLGLNLAFRSPSDTSSIFRPTLQPTLQNFIVAWQEADLGTAFANSFTVTIISVIGLMLLAALAAYPLARSTAKWSKLVFLIFMCGLLIPFLLALLPLYKTMRDLSLIGTLWSVILFNIGVQMPTAVFVLTGFLRTIPYEYEEAAEIDGANHLQRFFLIVVPLLRPALGTVAIFSTIFAWNDFLTPLLFLSGTKFQTLPLAIYTFVGLYTSRWNVFFAGLFLSIFPVIILFLLLQKHVIRGFSGGIKG